MPLNPSPSVLRAGEMLDFLARNGTDSYSVSEIARAIDLPRATCDSILLALAEQGLVVRRDPDLRYSLGPACITLGDAARGDYAMIAARPAAQDLARSTRSCVAVITLRGPEARVVDVFDHGPAFGLKTTVGQAVPLAAPFGAVFVAWDDDSAVDAWLDRTSERMTEKERARYRTALDAVRARGYSITVTDASHIDLERALTKLAAEPDAPDVLRRRDELMREIVHTEYLPARIDDDRSLRVSQMASPVFDRFGRVTVAIMVLGPPYEISAADVAALGTPLRLAAERATAALTGAPPTAAA